MNRSRYCFALIFLSLACLHPLYAQQPVPIENDEAATWKFGSEIDVLPYLSKGYYASAFAGRAGWRLRGVVARAEAPSFLVTDGFEKKRSDAYAVLMDRFFGRRRNRMEGPWVGVGVEYWRNRIRQENTAEFTHYNNLMLTAGGGYTWKFSKYLYLNPWAAVHMVAAGDRKIDVSGKTYNQSRFTPEASVKLGIIF